MRGGLSEPFDWGPVVGAWIAVALLSGLTAALLGNRRGWDWLVGVLGLVFGPLGVVIVLCMGRTAEAQAEYELDVANCKQRRTPVAANDPIARYAGSPAQQGPWA